MLTERGLNKLKKIIKTKRYGDFIPSIDCKVDLIKKIIESQDVKLKVELVKLEVAEVITKQLYTTASKELVRFLEQEEFNEDLPNQSESIIYGEDFAVAEEIDNVLQSYEEQDLIP